MNSSSIQKKSFNVNEINYPEDPEKFADHIKYILNFTQDVQFVFTIGEIKLLCQIPVITYRDITFNSITKAYLQCVILHESCQFDTGNYPVIVASKLGSSYIIKIENGSDDRRYGIFNQIMDEETFLDVCCNFNIKM